MKETKIDKMQKDTLFTNFYKTGNWGRQVHCAVHYIFPFFFFWLSGLWTMTLETESLFWGSITSSFHPVLVPLLQHPCRPLSVLGYRAKWNLLWSSTAVLVFIFQARKLSSIKIRKVVLTEWQNKSKNYAGFWMVSMQGYSVALYGAEYLH